MMSLPSPSVNEYVSLPLPPFSVSTVREVIFKLSIEEVLAGIERAMRYKADRGVPEPIWAAVSAMRKSSAGSPPSLPRVSQVVPLKRTAQTRFAAVEISPSKSKFERRRG